MKTKPITPGNAIKATKSNTEKRSQTGTCLEGKPRPYPLPTDELMKEQLTTQNPPEYRKSLPGKNS